MEQNLYLAHHDGSSLSHGKFKYIDKWKSKAGKWVYKYKEDAENAGKELGKKAKDAWNTVGWGGTGPNSGLHINANTSHKPKPSYRPPARTKERRKVNLADKAGDSRWHASNAATSIQGYDLVRNRDVKNEHGQMVSRREYKSSAENQSLNRSIATTNDAYKDALGPLASKIMDLNDKYGPKRVETIEVEEYATGRRYVESRVVNEWGFNRTVRAETYSYLPSEDKVLRKKKVNKKPRSKRRYSPVRN